MSSTRWSQGWVESQLNTCRRCSSLHRKCDNRLPSCHNCERADLECLFLDPASGEEIPRAYVKSLWERLQSYQCSLSPTSDGTGFVSDEVLSSLMAEKGNRDSRFCRHFVIETGPISTTRFHGASSPFTLAAELLDYATLHGFDLPGLGASIRHRAVDVAADIEFEKFVKQSNVYKLDMPLAKRLMSWYFEAVHPCYNFLDQFLIQQDLTGDFVSDSAVEKGVDGQDAFTSFRLSMICAISCASQARHNASFVGLGASLYFKAMKLFDCVTGDLSLHSLQALLLSILYCIFEPDMGDIWTLLDHACRLSLELANRGLGENVDEPQTEADAMAGASRLVARRRAFWTLYQIESLTCQQLGRCSDLSDSIVGWIPNHHAVDSDSASFSTTIAIARYELFHLRSHMFRELYTVPATAGELPWVWFADRYSTLYNWHHRFRELVSDFSTAEALHCTLEYHSTMMWLFQPHLLRALTHGRGSTRLNRMGGEKQSLSICMEGLHASIQTLETYEMIFSTGKGTETGKCPITSLSAYTIFLAAMTLVTHVVLESQRQTGGNTLLVVPLMVAGVGTGRDTCEVFDESRIQAAWNSCLTLLQWCAARWPRLTGMLHIVRAIMEWCGPGALTCVRL